MRIVALEQLFTTVQQFGEFLQRSVARCNSFVELFAGNLQVLQLVVEVARVLCRHDLDRHRLDAAMRLDDLDKQRVATLEVALGQAVHVVVLVRHRDAEKAERPGHAVGQFHDDGLTVADELVKVERDLARTGLNAGRRVVRYQNGRGFFFGLNLRIGLDLFRPFGTRAGRHCGAICRRVRIDVRCDGLRLGLCFAHD